MYITLLCIDIACQIPPIVAGNNPIDSRFDKVYVAFERGQPYGPSDLFCKVNLGGVQTCEIGV